MSDPLDLNQLNQRRRAAHDLPEGYPWIRVKPDTACPKCGDGRIEEDVSMILTSSPPQHHARCPKCDWKGYVIA